MSTRSRFVALAILVLAIVPTAVPAADWPWYRGRDHTASSTGNRLLDRDTFGLAVAWKRPLGSGYSTVVVAAGYGVTMFTDGSDDFLTAFDPETGQERWRYRIAEMYQGHTGSDDGPTSTPTIAGGTVYGLGPRGHLFAVRLEDGVELWSRTLDGTSDSRAPLYGYATAPLVTGDLVVVQTGGPDGHSITAFERHTGEPRWSLGDDPVNYQSPALVHLGGRTQLVAINDKFLYGLVPESGEVLWRHEHRTKVLEGFTQPQTIGEDRVVINSLGEVVVLAVASAGDVFEVAELWRSEDFRESFAVPVVHGGHLFGFRQDFLTCLDAATGEKLWRSRPPGGKGLILVDGRLVILTPGGELVVAAAAPQGYLEKARLPVFERGGMTPPSFAGGRVYLRNLTELASIRVTDTPLPAVAGKERELIGRFGDWVRRVEAAEDKATLVAEYLGGRESFPLIEGEDLVHFVYQGEVSDVALRGNFLFRREERPLDRIAGTDVYFKSLRLDPEAVWQYAFTVDFEPPAPDPRNPHTMGSMSGAVSILRMPRSQVPLEIDAVAADQRGRLDSFQLRSDVRGDERRIQLYLPSGYESSGATRYPLLVVLEPFGKAALGQGHMDRWLDRLIAEGRMAPAVAAFVSQTTDDELIGPNAADFARLLTEELFPLLEKHYRIGTGPGSRSALGVLHGATAALRIALLVPGTFGKIVVQSPVLVSPVNEELPALVRGSQGQALEVWVEIRRHDLKMPGVELEARVRDLVAAFAETDHTVHEREVAGSWGWASWRAQWDEILPALFPPSPAP